MSEMCHLTKAKQAKYQIGSRKDLVRTDPYLKPTIKHSPTDCQISRKQPTHLSMTSERSSLEAADLAGGVGVGLSSGRLRAVEGDEQTPKKREKMNDR